MTTEEKLRIATDALEQIRKHCICSTHHALKKGLKGFDYGDAHPTLGKAGGGSRWLSPRDLATVALMDIADEKTRNVA